MITLLLVTFVLKSVQSLSLSPCLSLSLSLPPSHLAYIFFTSILPPPLYLFFANLAIIKFLNKFTELSFYCFFLFYENRIKTFIYCIVFIGRRGCCTISRESWRCQGVTKQLIVGSTPPHARRVMNTYVPIHFSACALLHLRWVSWDCNVYTLSKVPAGVSLQSESTQLSYTNGLKLTSLVLVLEQHTPREASKKRMERKRRETWSAWSNFPHLHTQPNGIAWSLKKIKK